MTDDEVWDLLTVITACDRRTVGQGDFTVWKAVVGDLRFADAQEAVLGHFRDSAEWLMPATVRARVKDIRAERIRAAGPVQVPRHLADDHRAYQQYLITETRRIADGGQLRALEAR